MRANTRENKLSTYGRYPIYVGVEEYKEMESVTNPVMGQVIKARQVWVVGHTRIHLDKVQGLEGIFIELEVIIDPKIMTHADATMIMNHFVDVTGIQEADRLTHSYMDMLKTKESSLIDIVMEGMERINKVQEDDRMARTYMAIVNNDRQDK